LKVVARLYLPTVEEMMKNCGLDGGGEVQQHIDNFVLEQSEPYMPHKTGTLISEGIIASGGGQVIWNTPYAHYIHEGRLMISPTTGSPFAKKNEEKVYASPTRALFDSSEVRRDHWFDRMIIDKKEELIKECQAIVDGGK